MAEHDPFDELRALADDAEQLVDPPVPAAGLRQRGVQRGRRRMTATLVAAFVALVVSGAGVYSALQTNPQQPSPAQTPGVTATETPTPSASASGTPTPEIVPTPEPSLSGSATFVPNPPPATRTFVPRLTPSPTPTPTETPTTDPTATPGEGETTTTRGRADHGARAADGDPT